MTITRKDARSALRVALAQDAEIDKELLALALDEADEEEDTSGDDYEDDPENPGKRRKKVIAEDEGEEDDEDDEEKDKPAMDAATIQLAIDSAVKQAKADMRALYQAQKDVLPLVGEVAMDSAESVYKFALDKAGIGTKDIHPSAFKAMVDMLKTSKQHPKTITMDSAKRQDALTQFPGLKRFRGAL
jgi:hypothetical protein